MTTFTYRLRGMSNRTAHHYMRAYQMSLWKRVSGSYNSKKDDFCIGNIKRHKKALNLMSEFIETYKDTAKNHIAIMHYIENSHDSNDRAGHLDEDLYTFLKSNMKQNNFNNTAILLYSDHGARFSTERNSPQGYLEERQPFFSIYLPPDYLKANPNKHANLLSNSQQITTPFDIHETIRDLTCLDSKKSARSISVLDEIPAMRSCEQIGISLHYCVCEQDWITLNASSLLAVQAAQFTIDYINSNILKDMDMFCERLALKSPLTMKQTRINNHMYLKLVLVTMPNEGLYEVLIKYLPGHEGAPPRFEINSPDLISRSNQYGDQPKCLETAVKLTDGTTGLRKFCLCKTQASISKSV